MYLIMLVECIALAPPTDLVGRVCPLPPLPTNVIKDSRNGSYWFVLLSVVL